jgi:hypothetical protein
VCVWRTGPSCYPLEHYARDARAAALSIVMVGVGL